jgi:hypothetical protein
MNQYRRGLGQSLTPSEGSPLTPSVELQDWVDEEHTMVLASCFALLHRVPLQIT